MAPRLRFSDTFALVGILLLVTSVPGYVAQDDAARDLAGGYEFRTGEVRLGATLELEAIFIADGARPIVVGPTRTLTFRAADPSETPVPAAFVYEEAVHPIDVTLPFGHIEQPGIIERTYFDAQGLPVWHDEERWGTRQDGSVSHSRDSARLAAGNDADLAREAGTRLVYHPSGGQLAFIEVVDGARFGLSDAVFGRKVPATLTADAVVEHRGLHLFRTGHSALERLMTGDGNICDGCHTWHRLAVPIDIDDRLAPDGHRFYPEFEWYLPGWPAIAGMQMFYYDKATDERFLELQVVPRSHVPGDGETVTIRWFDRRGDDSAWVLPRGVPEVPLTALADVLADHRPLYRTIGFDALRAAVRGEEAASGLRQWAADAEPVEFYWIAEPPVLSGTEQPRDGFLPLPEAIQEPATKHPSIWYLTMARSDGDLRSVEVRFVEERGQLEVTGVRDVCGEQLHGDLGLTMICDDVPEDRMAPGRLVMDPWHLIDKARSDIARRSGGLDLPADPPREFAYQSLLYMEPEEDGYFTSAQTHSRMYLVASFNPHWVDASDEDDLLEGVAFYRHKAWHSGDALSASFDLRDGAVLAKSIDRSDAGPLPMATAKASSGAADHRLVPLAVVADSALAGGLLLIAISVLVRSASWLKAGGALPAVAVLYAKIKKDDVLQNERREEIMELVRNEPGVTASDLARRLGYGWGATVHHLETLVRNGFLTAITTGARRHYFTMEEGTRYSRVLAAARRDGVAASFLDAVAARPGATLKDLAALLDRKVSGLSRTGSRLAKEGLVRKERDGMSVRFWPVEMASSAPIAPRASGVATEG